MSDAGVRSEIRLQVHALNDLNQRSVFTLPRGCRACAAPPCRRVTRSSPLAPPRRVAEECYKKCVPNTRDGDLSIGEMTCIDRCVTKYLAAHELVSQELTTIRNAITQAPAASLPASAAPGTVSVKPR